MLKKIKEFLRKIIPVSRAGFSHEIKKQNKTLEQILKNLQLVKESQTKELTNQIDVLQKSQSLVLTNKIEELKEMQDTALKIQIEALQENQKKELAVLNNLIQEAFEKKMEELSCKNQELDERVEKLSLLLDETKRQTDEIVWAEIFNNLANHSKWLKDPSFSPGRWAVGYQYLYAMYRILDEFKPKKILEMGLGQSTRLISQYVQSAEGVMHYVTENNQEWITFFNNSYPVPEQTEIKYLPTKMENFMGYEVRVYDGFKETFEGMKFDCISIDAPWGGGLEKYDRIDILKILPQCLEENFVILVDDYNRKLEKNTVEEIKKVLEEHKIAFKTGKYSGVKDVYVITSINNAYLCSM